jgi:hypothetical protein
MPTFQHSELLPEREILQNEIPAITEKANQSSDPEKKQAEHGTELYQINDWKYCCKLSSRASGPRNPMKSLNIRQVRAQDFNSLDFNTP